MKKLISIILVAALLLGAFSLLASAAPDLTLPSLKEVYKDHFYLGNVLEQGVFVDDRLALMEHHFNSLTCEDNMKPHTLYTQDRQLDFTKVEAQLAHADGIAQLLHGHFLFGAVEYSDVTPDWMFQNDDLSPLTRQQAQQRAADHINAVAGQFAGRVYSWDVINEALRGEWLGYLDWRHSVRKDNIWLAFENGAAPGESGADYIDFAFRTARAADPNAVLYYNENKMNFYGKPRLAAAMIKEINDKWLAEGNDRLLIEGIGMQAHFNLSTKPKDFERNIKMFADMGLEISISEVSCWIDPQNRGFGNSPLPTPIEIKLQAQKYAELFQVLKRNSHVIKRVTFWGLDDGWNSSVPIDLYAIGSAPHMFDAELNAKPAFYAVADPDGYLRDNPRMWFNGFHIYMKDATKAMWMNEGLYSEDAFTRMQYRSLYLLMLPGAEVVRFYRSLKS